MSRRAREQLRRKHVLLPSCRWQQPHAFAAIASGHDSLGTNEDGSVAGQDAWLSTATAFTEDSHSWTSGALSHIRWRSLLWRSTCGPALRAPGGPALVRQIVGRWQDRFILHAGDMIHIGIRGSR